MSNAPGPVPPERLLGARLVLAFVTMLLVSGIGNTFPVFFPPLLEEFGGTRAATASTLSLLWLGGALLGPVSGQLIGRLDPRWLVGVGLAAVAVGLTGGILAPNLTVFVLCVGLGTGIGVGLTGMVTQAALLADVYVRRRGVAVGIAFAGAMAGFALAGPAQLAISRFGWRGALAGYVAAIVALVPWAARVYPRRLGAATPRPEVAASERAVSDVVRSLAFWVLALVFAFPPLIGYLATTQHALYLTARGFTAEEASLLLTIGGVLAASGRVLAGIASDRLGGTAAGGLSFGLTLAGLLCLVAMELRPAAGLVYGYVLFLFLPMGSRATIVSVLVGRIAPGRLFGPVLGYLSIGNNLCAALGPVLSGALYDRTGSYLIIYMVATGLVLISLAAVAVFATLTRGGT